ncbi:MAG: cytochrome c3 family protein [Myxococcota bacterium]|nr:cytochrome c3 family protein [Myxococcota bacterium]
MAKRLSTLRPSLASAAIALSAAALFGILIFTVGQQRASADAPRLAGSVCEAQLLKAMLAENPDANVEIPPEFDKPHPTLEACESHDLAWSDDVEGPNQPIPFSHLHHAGRYEIPCLYCHAGTDRSQAAGVPSVELCMGCHEHFDASYDELEGIRILKEHWEAREPIRWVQVHRAPEHVQFQHQAHVRAGIECQQCHGRVEEMEKIWFVPDRQLGPTAMPTKKLEMGWCINCHRDNGASQDCFTCHY